VGEVASCGASWEQWGR